MRWREIKNNLPTIRNGSSEQLLIAIENTQGKLHVQVDRFKVDPATHQMVLESGQDITKVHLWGTVNIPTKLQLS